MMMMIYFFTHIVVIFSFLYKHVHLSCVFYNKLTYLLTTEPPPICRGLFSKIRTKRSVSNFNIVELLDSFVIVSVLLSLS